MPKASILEAWSNQVPDDFKFVLKVPKQITHIKQLVGVDDSFSCLLEVIGALKDRMGPLLFQLPPHFKKDLDRLHKFLVLLPPDRQAAFEFRHQSWFCEETFTLLREYRIALCIAEVDDGVEIPFVSTTNWGYLRLRRSDYGDVELKAWAERLRKQNWKDAFIFFKHEDEGKGPQIARRFLDLIG